MSAQLGNTTASKKHSRLKLFHQTSENYSLIDIFSSKYACSLGYKHVIGSRLTRLTIISLCVIVSSPSLDIVSPSGESKMASRSFMPAFFSILTFCSQVLTQLDFLFNLPVLAGCSNITPSMMSETIIGDSINKTIAPSSYHVCKHTTLHCRCRRVI